MFRVEFFCEDKKVGDALRSLMGIAIGVPAAHPVINAEAKGGKIKAQSDGKLLTMFAHHIMNSKADMIAPKEVMAWLKNTGMSPLSVSYVLKQGILRGMLKRKGIGQYAIIRALPKPKAKGGTHG